VHGCIVTAMPYNITIENRAHDRRLVDIEVRDG
jgi:hypothetical protein